MLDPFVTSFLGFAPPTLRKASTRIRSLRMTRAGLALFSLLQREKGDRRAVDEVLFEVRIKDKAY